MQSSERVEYEFDNHKFMTDIHTKMGRECSLREIEDQTGVSASTYSRISNGHLPALDVFMQICSRVDLIPGDYFRRVVWQRKD